MKIFDFLVKIAIFGAFLFQSRDSRHAIEGGRSIEGHCLLSSVLGFRIQAEWADSTSLHQKNRK